jgi:hypothetical protein
MILVTLLARFHDDPVYREVCKRFQDGEPTDKDFDYMNECVFNVELPDGTCMNPGGATIADMPLDMAYAVPTNQD